VFVVGVGVDFFGGVGVGIRVGRGLCFLLCS